MLSAAPHRLTRAILPSSDSLTPAEFKSIRNALGLSAQAMARGLGVSDGRTVRRWEAGDRDIPGTLDALLPDILNCPHCKRALYKRARLEPL